MKISRSTPGTKQPILQTFPINGILLSSNVDFRPNRKFRIRENAVESNLLDS